MLLKKFLNRDVGKLVLLEAWICLSWYHREFICCSR